MIDRWMVIAHDSSGEPIYAGKYLGSIDVAAHFPHEGGGDNPPWKRELTAWSRLPAHDHGFVTGSKYSAPQPQSPSSLAAS